MEIRLVYKSDNQPTILTTEDHNNTLPIHNNNSGQVHIPVGEGMVVERDMVVVSEVVVGGVVEVDLVVVGVVAQAGVVLHSSVMMVVVVVVAVVAVVPLVVDAVLHLDQDHIPVHDPEKEIVVESIEISAHQDHHHLHANDNAIDQTRVHDHIQLRIHALLHHRNLHHPKAKIKTKKRKMTKAKTKAKTRKKTKKRKIKTKTKAKTSRNQLIKVRGRHHPLVQHREVAVGVAAVAEAEVHHLVDHDPNHEQYSPPILIDGHTNQSDCTPNTYIYILIISLILDSSRAEALVFSALFHQRLILVLLSSRSTVRCALVVRFGALGYFAMFIF